MFPESGLHRAICVLNIDVDIDTDAVIFKSVDTREDSSETTLVKG